jgi:glycolate oxidase iron-sulfur subunit
MQTSFSPAQLADPDTRSSNGILRSCVHCGFCTATCPTFVLLGDELDSPRGRIYLIKDMLEGGQPATEQVVRHVDRCLSCLSCMTTCPSGVNYMHLVDHARKYIEETYTRPWPERLLRRLLGAVLPYPRRFRWAMRAAALARPLRRLVPGGPAAGGPAGDRSVAGGAAGDGSTANGSVARGPGTGGSMVGDSVASGLVAGSSVPGASVPGSPMTGAPAAGATMTGASATGASTTGAAMTGGSMTAQRLRAMLELAPASLPARGQYPAPRIHPAQGPRRGRVALLTGCAQTVLAPSINDATIRLLTRMGVEVVVTRDQGCCGALNHHMGQHDPAMALARANIDAWTREMDGEGLDAVVINASGCGTTVKDYGFMFRAEPGDWPEKAAAIAAKARDISEVLLQFDYAPTREAPAVEVAYHAACSLQHGQQITAAPKQLLARAGFQVREPAEPHLCCGSAGTYNLMQPAIAGQLRERKLENLRRTGAALVASGNIGCLTQLGGNGGMPTVHTVELLDWMAGGPKPVGVA